MTPELWAATRAQFKKVGDVEWSPTTMTRRMVTGGLIGTALGSGVGAARAEDGRRARGAVAGGLLGGLVGVGAGRALHALRPVTPGAMAGHSQSLANNSAGSLFSAGDDVYRTTGKEPEWSEDPTSPYRKWHDRWVKPYSDHARNNPAAPTYTAPDGRVQVFRNGDRLLAQIDADQKDDAGRIGGAAVHAVRNVTGPGSSEAFAQEALEYVRKNYGPHGLTFGKEAFSPHLIGAGIGAAAGAYTAPKDENGRRQGVLSRTMMGAGLGAGASIAGAGLLRAQPRAAFHASPLGTVYRTGSLRAGAEHVGRSAREMGQGMVAAKNDWVRDARAVVANPVGAAKDVGRAATAPVGNLLRRPVQTVTQGASRMGDLGTAMYAGITVPGALADFQQTQGADGNHRGIAERTLSAGSRLALPLAAAGTATGTNRITNLVGGMIGEQAVNPLASRLGRAIDGPSRQVLPQPQGQ